MSKNLSAFNIRTIAAEVIFNVLHDNKSLALCLSEQELATKQIEQKDISFLKALCFGFFRNYFLLDGIVNKLIEKPLPNKSLIIKVIIMLGLYQIIYLRTPSYAAINEAVNSAKIYQPHAAKLVNAVLRNFLRNQQSIEQALQNKAEVMYQHPKFLIDLIKHQYPNSWKNILINNNSQAPLTIRINKLRITKAKFLQILIDNGIEYTENHLLDTCIFLSTKTDIKSLTSFKEGLFSVQDLSPQCAAMLLDPKPNDRILDACSAPGGKACHLLELEPNLNEIIALDVSAKRLKLLEDNITRLQLPNKIKIVCNDAKNTSEWFDGSLFDKILLDAPCSATGIIRRQPDIKVLRTLNNIKELHKQQLELIEALWPTLKPGGVLLYATCSILREENIDVVQQFIETNKDAAVINFSSAMQKKLEFATREPIDMQILPGSIDDGNNMDGFYYALLQKKSSSITK